MKLRFTAVSLLIILSMLLAACGGATPAEDAPVVAEEAAETASESGSEAAPANVSPSGYSEAPMLAEMSAAGELPPVDERLPIEPMVIEPIDEIGTYGGTLRRVYLGPADGCNYWRISRGGLFRFSVDGFTVIPAVAKGWESNDDGTEWTVFLREGLKWSDGDPFDAEDFMWHYENVLLNEELTPSLPLFLRSGDEFGTMEAVDDYTIKFVYPNPNFLFLEVMAQADQACGTTSRNVPYTPAHYMQQFHADFNSDIDALVAEADFENWAQLYDNKVGHNTNAERPTTRPWKFQEELGAQVVTAMRNPYFYAVDTAGNQLPYIDKVTFTLVEDLEVANLKAVEGDIDFQGRHIKMDNFPTLKAGEETGGYRIVLWPTFGGADITFFLNMSYPGPVGEAMRIKEFRQALSIAIDRESIREISLLGLGELRQSVPAPGHPHYPGEEYEKMFTEYDVDLANSMLDEILPEKDDEGFRLGSDGERLVVNIGTTAAFGAWPDVSHQVARNWEAIGIKAEVEETTRSLYETRLNNNEFAVSVWNEDTTGFTFSIYDKRAVCCPGSRPGPAWGLWVDTNGAEGEEPPDYMMELLEMHQRGLTLPEEERNALGQEIYKIIAENVYNIGVVGLSPMVQGVLVTNANLRNVPEKGGNDWPLRTPATAFPEQLFYAE